MRTVVSWLFSLIGLNKFTDPIQKFLSGKKSYLAGAGLAIPALLTILGRFTDQGSSYLTIITSTPEWALFLNGIAVMGIRAAVTKAADPKQDPNYPNQSDKLGSPTPKGESK